MSKLTFSPEELEFLSNVKEGCYRESDLVRFIKKRLRSPEQKTFLDTKCWSIEEILNGNNELSQDTAEQNFEERFLEGMFKDWNDKLGYHSFGSEP